jgi:hypothetical protein
VRGLPLIAPQISSTAQPKSGSLGRLPRAGHVPGPALLGSPHSPPAQAPGRFDVLPFPALNAGDADVDGGGTVRYPLWILAANQQVAQSVPPTTTGSVSSTVGVQLTGFCAGAKRRSAANFDYMYKLLRLNSEPADLSPSTTGNSIGAVMDGRRLSASALVLVGCW